MRARRLPCLTHPKTMAEEPVDAATRGFGSFADPWASSVPCPFCPRFVRHLMSVGASTRGSGGAVAAPVSGAGLIARNAW